LEGTPFSAHPVYEPDGSIWNAGIFGDQLLIYHVGADGSLRTAQLLKLPRDGYMHSFTASTKHLVFVLAPLVRVREGGSFFEGLGWRDSLGSQMIVVPKADLSQPRFAEFESGAAYHYADAWDEKDGSLCLRACWYGNQAGFVSPFGDYMRGQIDKPNDISAEWVQVRLNPNAKRAELIRSGIMGVEFPIATRLMQKAPNIVLQGRPQHPNGALSGVLSLDADGKALGHYDFGDDFIVEEQLYVRAEGKRYTLGTVFNAKQARTGLVLMDLDRLGDGPVAQAWLSRAMPLGFHGTFVGAGAGA
jgi:all-trans-8'-apo-beta-carotenal 15,15'-oxygenase